MKGPKQNPPLLLEAYAASDIGRRKNNEDAYLVNDKMGLFIVADGMGGHDKGEIASWFTSENLEKIISTLRNAKREETLDTLPPLAATADYDVLMEYAVLYINRLLYEENEKEAAKLARPLGSAEAEIAALAAKKKRMGTTLVSLLIRNGRAHLIHVGDSRAYRISENSILRLTKDHSWVEERVREGTLAPEEAAVHEKRNIITRSVGFKSEVNVDINVFAVNPPERFLLCSDGLSNVVDETTLLELGRMRDLNVACKRMVSLAKDLGGRDNITAVLVDVKSAKKSKIKKRLWGTEENTDM